MMKFELAYFIVISLAHLGFAAVFLFLYTYMRSVFLKYFALAWSIESLRVMLYIVQPRWIEFSDQWFTLQDILYLLVTWLLIVASGRFVGRRGPRLLWGVLYFGLSIPLILGNYLLMWPDVVQQTGGARPDIFHPALWNKLLVFVPGGILRMWITLWFIDYWRRARTPGALLVVLFCFLQGLGSLLVPVQGYFPFFAVHLYSTWFLEVLGLSVGMVMLSANRQHAELLRAERKYELFFEHIADGALLYDERERCLTANPVARERLGLAGAGQPLRDLFEDEADYLAVRQEIFKLAPVKLEARLRTAGGESFPASICGGVDYGLDGKLTGYFVTFDDITERRRAAAERERLLSREQSLRAEAEAANRLKDEFLATVSHELRAPLNSIFGWARILRGGGLSPEKAARAYETIEHSARAQNKLIGDLLDVSRVITGKLRLDVRAVAPAPVVEAAVEAARPAAEAKSISLQVSLDSQAEDVAGDADRLQQVVWNLVSNAIKFTPHGGRVEVRLARALSHVEIAVSDTGQGIAPEFLPHVFERFRQQDGSTTRRHGGLGLGLAIVRHLVELHGGTVRAESPGEGLGSTFIVTLPLRTADHGLRIEPAQGAGLGEGDRKSAMRNPLSSILRGVRVLVVDDEAETREFLGFVLRQEGAEVVAAATAAESLAKLTDWRPDVLVADISLPGEDGYELIGKVRAQASGRELPAVALTAYARAEDRMRVLASGYQMHLSKPAEPEELVAMVASLAGRLSKWQVI